MEITAKTIIFAVVPFILIVAILGGVYFLLKNSKQFNINKNEDAISKLQVINLSPTPAVTATSETTAPENNTSGQGLIPVTQETNTKIYQGQNYTLKYPANWGILTCNNSKNIEFDPYNRNDLINYSCSQAVKPVTVLVSNKPINCVGESVRIGNHNVIRSKTETANWVKNRWCLIKNGVYLDITNRVAPTGITGTSKDSFSAQIEQIISNI